MNNQQLADLLFPTIDIDVDRFEDIYPPRTLPADASVTRLGPSPTGFIHLGNLYGALANRIVASQSNGVFFLRIEDTDDKRYVEGAVDAIIDGLDFFEISFDEGATKSGESGDYGPYHQSLRKEVYQSYVKKLLAEDLAYPCFMTEEEISTIREEQSAAKVAPGIYGSYSKYRNCSYQQIAPLLDNNVPYVIRLKSSGNPYDPQRVTVSDGIRGNISFPENFHDVVILKASGLPTYHMAHACDDHLMRTTHVIRGEEWLSSLPTHVELFEKLGFQLPIYCHTSVLMKLDEQGNKRKLSKREDPELSLHYYRKKGYHPTALREYLLTLLNSNYEEWRLANPSAESYEFDFSLEKMTTSGTLFDLNKVNDVSKDVISKIPSDQLFEFLLIWAKEYSPLAYQLMADRKPWVLKILDLGRTGNKPRKDLMYGEQIFQFISYFFDMTFEIVDPLPDETSPADAHQILSQYLDSYDHNDNQSAWFDKIRAIGENLGYAAKPKDFKKSPEKFKGHVGHVSTVIRIALTGRSQSPDIWEIQQILGEEKTLERLRQFSHFPTV